MDNLQNKKVNGWMMQHTSDSALIYEHAKDFIHSRCCTEGDTFNQGAFLKYIMTKTKGSVNPAQVLKVFNEL